MSTNLFLFGYVSGNLSEEERKDAFLGHAECGADILLASVSLGKTKEEKIKILNAAKGAAEDKIFAAGEIAAGDETAARGDYIKYIQDEVRLLLENGVSAIFLNGFTTIRAAKYAYLAANEICELPICIGITPSGGILSDGCKVLNAQLILQALGADAVGCTYCSFENASEALSIMSEFTAVPLYALIDMPKDSEPSDFAELIPNLISAKCAAIGAAKGGGERATAEMSKIMWQFNPHLPDFEKINAVCSKSECVFFDFNGNPAGNNKNILEIKIEDDCAEIDKLLEIINSENSAPVCFNVKDPEILRRLLYEYIGLPAVKSDEYGEIAAREIGAFIIPPKKEK